MVFHIAGARGSGAASKRYFVVSGIIQTWANIPSTFSVIGIRGWVICFVFKYDCFGSYRHKWEGIGIVLAK